MIVKPLRDMVLVEEYAGPEKTEGGLSIPETASATEHKANVVAVGPGRMLDSGEIKPVAVKIGDRVLFWMNSNRARTEATHKGQRLLLLNENEILAVVQVEVGDQTRSAS
jgi:chaperonin GroES